MKIFRKKTSEKFAKRARVSFVMAMIFGLSFQLASAWTDPGAAAPGGNVGAPLTTGNSDQKREGDLKIGDIGNDIKNNSKNGILDVDDVWIRSADGGNGAWASALLSSSNEFLKGYKVFDTDSEYQIPEGVYAIKIQAWGAGGGGAYGTARGYNETKTFQSKDVYAYKDADGNIMYNNNASIPINYINQRITTGGSGASGGYATETIKVSPGDFVRVIVGKGGAVSDEAYRIVRPEEATVNNDSFGTFGTSTWVRVCSISGCKNYSAYADVYANGTNFGGSNGNFNSSGTYNCTNTKGLIDNQDGGGFSNTNSDYIISPLDVKLGNNGNNCIKQPVESDDSGTGVVVNNGGAAVTGDINLPAADLGLYSFGAGGNGSGLNYMPYFCTIILDARPGGGNTPGNNRFLYTSAESNMAGDAFSWGWGFYSENDKSVAKHSRFVLKDYTTSDAGVDKFVHETISCVSTGHTPEVGIPTPGGSGMAIISWQR